LSNGGVNLSISKKLTVEQCEQDPSILSSYFRDYATCSEYIVQEAIEGFTRNWETRCFWWKGKFLYAIANMAAVSSKDGKECIITGDDIPKEFLENAKRIGRAALQALPKMTLPNGKTIDQILLRTDVGCCDSELHDNTYNWNPNKKTFFLNEIEPSSTTYFVRWVLEHIIVLWKFMVGNGVSVPLQMTTLVYSGAHQNAVRRTVIEKRSRWA